MKEQIHMEKNCNEIEQNYLDFGREREEPVQASQK